VAKDIIQWDPENKEFWQKRGKAIANRNLWISIPSLLCAFAVWGYWGIITVQMLNLGFSFSPTELFTLAAIAGLTGATLRIPSTFFIRLAGGRNTIFFTTALLIIPAIWTGCALMNVHTPLWEFQVLALLSGIGGGNFASSMSNISFFFPKKTQGYALGMNAGLGNFGVTTMQILIPLAMTYGIFGGAGRILKNTSGTLFGKIPAGSETWIQNGAFIWLLFLVPLFFISWWGMNNLRAKQVSPDIGRPLDGFIKMTVMLLIGFITAIVGLWLMLPRAIGGSGFGVSKWIVVPLVIAVTVLALRFLPGKTGESIKHQYKIFNNKHTWAMTIIYTMTFGSFIGYAAAFALSIKVVFGFKHILVNGVWTNNTINPLAPSALTYAWMGAFVGALIRPIGGMIADRFGGARVTNIISIIMVLCAIGVAHYMKLAYHSAMPQQYFTPFLLLFLVLFAATGVGNGSTFRTAAIVFNREQAGPVLGWISAVAAYGAFIIPQVFGEQLQARTPQYALYGFAVFYVICIIINWWFYLRPGAYVKNP
jgi:MFS transporter, NNP family, nitrate/nitrite transporter